MTAEQLHVIREIKSEARRRYASVPSRQRRYMLTGLEIGDVETHFQNLTGGDADSAGFRQERRSLYKDPTNLRASINRMFDEMEQHDRGQTTGQLAADVQRPREDLRGKYALSLGTARKLAGGNSSNDAETPVTSSTPGHVQPGVAPRLTQGSTKTDNAAAMLAAVTDKRKGMPLLQRFNEQVATGKYTTTTAPKVTSGKSPRFAPGAAGEPATSGKHGEVSILPTADRAGVHTKGAVIRFVKQIAGVYGKPLTIGTGTNHNQFVAGTNRESAHWTGRAADIPMSGAALTRLGRDALIAAGMPRAQALKQTGGVFNIGGYQILFNTNVGGNHFNHLHVGLHG